MSGYVKYTFFLFLLVPILNISAPGSYSELKSLLHGHAADEQSTILSRLRKCHHPSLAEGNKEKLEVTSSCQWSNWKEKFSQSSLCIVPWDIHLLHRTGKSTYHMSGA